jgi:hypothetical protein
MNSTPSRSINSLNQHFKKRKSRTSFSPATLNTTSGKCSSTSRHTLSISTTSLTKELPSGVAAAAGLDAALNALSMSLKFEMENFAPPTPAVSPVSNWTNAKRPRFDFAVVEGIEVSSDESRVRKAPHPFPLLPTCTNGKLKSKSSSHKVKSCGALLAVSTRIKIELEKKQKLRETNEKQRQQRTKRRKNHQQLNYFAIAGAFQRAAMERELGTVASAAASANSICSVMDCDDC